jgi:hypothetical protein
VAKAKQKIRLRHNRAVKPGQTQSNSIKLEKVKGSQESEQIRSGPHCGLLAPPETINPGQTKSNQIKPAKGSSVDVKWTGDSG